MVVHADHRVAARVLLPKTQERLGAWTKRLEQAPAEVQRTAQVLGLLRRQARQRIREDVHLVAQQSAHDTIVFGRHHVREEQNRLGRSPTVPIRLLVGLLAAQQPPTTQLLPRRCVK